MADDKKNKSNPFQIPLEPTGPEGSSLEAGAGYTDDTTSSLNYADIKTKEQVGSTYTRLATEANNARAALDAYLQENPHLTLTGGEVKDTSRVNNPLIGPPVDPKGQQLYQNAINAEKNYQNFDSWATDMDVRVNAFDGLETTGAAYVETETSRKLDVRNKFLDFLQEIQDVGKREADAVQSSMERQSMQRDMQRRGDLAPGANIVGSTFVPSGASLSSMARRSIPDTANLPALESFGGYPSRPRESDFAAGSYGTLPRFAAGTDVAGQGFRHGMERMDLSGVPQDLQWLVGAPDVFAPELTPDMPRLPMPDQTGQPMPVSSVLDERPPRKVNSDSMLYSRLA